MTPSAEGPTSPGSESRAVRQLLYTNADRVVDGVKTGGWQILEQSPALDDVTASRLLALVEPRLNPVSPLSGFPTPEEIANAARRYAQIPTDDGTVLVHTAPAGADATGRPNTMNHVVLLADEERPSVCTADLWRSPDWCVPFGPDEVRATAMPASNRIRAGQSVSDDSVSDFMAVPGRGAVLVALAEILDGVLAQRVNRSATSVDKTTTVLLPVPSTDEAALWVGALQRTCAPRTGRLLGFSTLERVGTERDLEALAASGIDLACVPEQDLAGMPIHRSGLAVVDPQTPPTSAPDSAWARMVAAMTADLGAWVAGVEAVRDVLDLLEDHRDVAPGWPLAMAEACDPGLLAGRAEELVGEAVEHELVACQPGAIAGNGYLIGVVNDRVLGSAKTDPGHWYSRLSAVPVSAPVTGVVAGLARKYVETAVRNPRWLLDPARQVSRRAFRCLDAWSRSAEGREALVPLLEAAVHAVSQDPRETAVLIMVDRLVRDGVNPPGARTDELLIPVARALAAEQDPMGQRARILGLDLDRRCRDALMRLVERVLEESAGAESSRTLPWMSEEVIAWFDGGAVAPALGELAAQAVLIELAGLIDRPVAGPAAATAERAVKALHGVVGGFELRPDVVRLLADFAPIDCLEAPPPGWRNVWDVLGPALLREPDSPASARICREYLARRGHPEAVFAQSVFNRFSVPTAVCLVVLVRHTALMTRYSVQAAGMYARHILLAAAILDGDPLVARSPAVAMARSKALALLILVVWNGQQVDLPDAPALPAAVQNLDAALDEDPSVLAAPGETGLGELLPLAVTRVFWRGRGSDIPDEWFDSVDQDLRRMEYAESRSNAQLRNCDNTVVVIARSWAAYLGAGQSETLRAALLERMGGAPGAERWLDKRVLPAKEASGLRRRLFGGR